MHRHRCPDFDRSGKKELAHEVKVEITVGLAKMNEADPFLAKTIDQITQFGLPHHCRRGDLKRTDVKLLHPSIKPIGNGFLKIERIQLLRRSRP